ncbi:MAG: M23 family metallopeptidase [Bacillota bacterium]
MHRRRAAVRLILYLLAATIVFPGPSTSHATTAWTHFIHPVSDISRIAPNYYYDLNRVENQMKDYTGWSCTNCTDVWGHTYDQHSGVDYPIGKHGAIYAAQAGTVDEVVVDSVELCYFDSQGKCTCNSTGNWQGTYVRIRHPLHYGDNKQYYTWYLHMIPTSLTVSKNDTVGKYSQLGTANNTGYSCGDHLHWRVDEPLGTRVDPFDRSLVCGFLSDPYCSDDITPEGVIEGVPE